MTLAEAIIEHVKALPQVLQAEVLDFVEYLQSKAHAGNRDEEKTDWSALSLSQAMRGMEGESSPYSTDDLKEVFS